MGLLVSLRGVVVDCLFLVNFDLTAFNLEFPDCLDFGLVTNLLLDLEVCSLFYLLFI